MPPKHRQMYEQLIERARDVLDRHPGVARQDPEWDTLRISIARQQGANTNAILEMANHALQRWPCFYPLHNAAVNALLPRWGGSRKAIQTYTKLALEHSRSLEGTQAYARIYYYIARTAYDALDELNRMDGDYPTFQRSIGEILEKYPSNFNRDIARNMAYLAGDAAAYRSYGRASTGGMIPIAQWDTVKWRDWANQWAFEGRHATSASPLRRIRAYLSLFRQGPEFWRPLRWGALGAVLLIELTFGLLAWRARRSFAKSSARPAGMGAFNPFDYPRTYHLIPLGGLAIRIGIWMAVFCGAAAYILTTVAWPDPEETRFVMGGLVTLAVGGALIVVNVITSRVILRADGLELRRLVGSRSIRRSDILGVRTYAAATPVLEVVPHANAGRPLLITPVSGEDRQFRLWFESLPALAPIADDDEDEDEGEGSDTDSRDLA
jgi:PH (Pleckstrin Homology) domain-containing protein